jgi:hypothetical protein
MKSPRSRGTETIAMRILKGLLADDSDGKNDKLIAAVRRLLQSATIHARTGKKASASK